MPHHLPSRRFESATAVIPVTFGLMFAVFYGHALMDGGATTLIDIGMSISFWTGAIALLGHNIFAEEPL
jgi:putative copper export protein